MATMFESLVNSEQCQTGGSTINSARLFESLVNSEECQTTVRKESVSDAFESLVNSEECQTLPSLTKGLSCLRVLLIQKSVKPFSYIQK